jgi:hypothetical protein
VFSFFVNPGLVFIGGNHPPQTPIQFGYVVGTLGFVGASTLIVTCTEESLIPIGEDSLSFDRHSCSIPFLVVLVTTQNRTRDYPRSTLFLDFIGEPIAAGEQHPMLLVENLAPR